MHEGQAYVVEQRCIGCGTCVRECPQGAKSYRDDVERTRRLFADGQPVAASVAPSFAAVFAPWQRRRLASALRRLGFCHVAETAIGAAHVARQTKAQAEARPSHSLICTACPAVVRYVELYAPTLVPHLAGVVSPMVAHARHIQRRLGPDTKVVFIGPCVAKKAEAQRPEQQDAVAAVLTFTELIDWLQREGIELSACEESDFDDAPEGAARLFPLEGGAVRTAGWTTDLLSPDVQVASGFEEVRAALEAIPAAAQRQIIEPLFCAQGCINGPAMPQERHVPARRSDVLEYAATSPGLPLAAEPQVEQTRALAAVFQAAEPVDPVFSEEQIRQVLAMTGKARDEDQLNCGACGYGSCREKAIAVLRGMAEPQMCLPHMRRLAEQRVDRIIESSPNGIVILDDQLRILHMNPAFRRFFMCSDALYTQPVSTLLDPEPFERLVSGQEEMIEMMVEHKRYGLICHQIMYPLREERQYVGIFVNVTNSRSSQQKLDRLRSQTIVQARELLEHQLQMAENIARFLGESSARGEDLVEKLMVLAEEEGDTGKGGNRQWLRDMYTSK